VGALVARRRAVGVAEALDERVLVVAVRARAVQAKSIPWPISGYGLAPGNVTPSESIPPPWTSYSLKICGE